jgi:hypothetical protein
MEDDDYAELQLYLAMRPEVGKVIRGSGGIRKARWTGSGRGKRGGLRIIYYWFVNAELIYLLYVYPKCDQEDLRPDQLKMLKAVVKETML